jgi:NAD(P) transhydrogenase subunit alpha
MNGVILMEIYVFVLACFAGYQLIAKVPPTLHTPLMSGSNAISGITLLGALYVARLSEAHGYALGMALGFVAVACANVNVVGGFGVTERMLKMFRSHDAP